MNHLKIVFAAIAVIFALTSCNKEEAATSAPEAAMEEMAPQEAPAIEEDMSTEEAPVVEEDMSTEEEMPSAE